MKRAITTALALTLTLIAPLTSEAVPVEAWSVYTPSIELAGTDWPATLTIMNSSALASGASITEVVIRAAEGLVFDGFSALTPNPAFTTVPAIAALTGFTGQTVAPNTLTLGFTGFDPQELFSFAIDVDTLTNRNVPASAFASSILEVTFGGSIPAITLSATYAVETYAAGTHEVEIAKATLNGDGAAAVPEPATLFLLGSGLLGMGLLGRLRWSRRIKN